MGQFDEPHYLVLGPVEVLVDGRPAALGGAQRRAVLAQLVLRRGEVVSVDAITAGLWGDRPPPTATKAIQVHVSKLRPVLPADALRTRQPGYVLDVPPEATDVGCFDSWCERARAAAADGDLQQASSCWGAALDLWRGDPLADVVDHPFAAPAVARLAQLREAAVEERLAVELELGRHHEVLGDIEELVAAAPRRERPWALLMTARHRCGRPAEALEAFVQARAALVEVGLEPSPELRDLERQLLDRSLPSPAARAGALPSVLRAPARLVGRGGPIARLSDLFAEVEAGASAVAVVQGDEGMGKSALVSTFARGVHDRARVLAGRCRQHAVTPYGPWQAIFDQLGAHRVSDLLRGGSADAAPERVRLQLFEQTVAALRRAAFDDPCVVVLDDLHWTDDGTVDLLSYALDELESSPVLFLLAWRHREVGAGHRLGRLEASLVRGRTVRLDLEPLAIADIEAMLAATALEVPGSTARVAMAIEAVTGGVPLFTTEVVTSLAASHQRLPEDPSELATRTPTTLTGLVARRLVAVSPTARRLATCASVLGDQLDAQVLCEMCDEATLPEVVQALDELVRAGLLVETALGHTFVHGSFRWALLDEVRAGERQLLHAAALRALQAGSAPAAERVHHAEQAARLVEPMQLDAELAEAAASAYARGAFADAASFHERRIPLATPEQLAAVHLAVADAAGRAGDLAELKRSGMAALEAARRHGAPDRVVVEAVGRIGVFGDGFGVDAEVLEATRDAVDLVTDEQAVATLISARAYHQAMWGAPRSVVAEELAAARSACPVDPAGELTGSLLFAEGLAALGDPDLGRRFRIVEDLLAVDDGDPAVPHRGRALRLRCLAEMSAGRLGALRQTLDEVLEVAEETGSWLYRSDAIRWGIAATIASGDRAAAAAAIDDLEQVSSSPLAGRAFAGTQRMLLQWLGGEPVAAIAYLDAMRAVLPPQDPCGTDRRLVDLLRLAALVEAERVDEARAGYEALVPWRDLDRAACRRYGAELALCSLLAVELGDAEAAPGLLDRLAPFAGQLVVLSWGECLLGSFDGYAAGLRTLLDGAVDEAGFARALGLERDAGDLLSARRTEARLARVRAAWPQPAPT